MRDAGRLDERGRLAVRPGFRGVLGEKVVQVLTPRGLLLRPVPDRLPRGGRLPPALRASGGPIADEETGD